ncbi:MAG: SCP2 sterol-binding domain-containing protein [Candidatus Sigynarchaeota archaeon]
MPDNRNLEAVLCAGVGMQFVGVAMLAIPNLAFDVSNPIVVFPAYTISLVIISIGVGITLVGARNAISIAKRGMVIGAPSERVATIPGPNVIRPVLVKKGTSEPTPVQKVVEKPIDKPFQAAKSTVPTENSIIANSGPADAESIKAALNMISERYNRPDVRSKFDGWVNSLVIEFPDINKSFVFKINGAEGIQMSEGSDDTAAVQVTMTSDMFVKLLSKQINAIKAYSSGALKVKGEMKNLLKLRKLMF